MSSCFILVRPGVTGENDVLAMGDCAININPTEDELVEIAGETAECARIFGVDPQIASYRIGSRICCTAKQRIRNPHFYQHCPKIICLQQNLPCPFRRNSLALTQ